MSVRSEGGTVRLVLTNQGSSGVRVTVTDAYGHNRTATYRLQPGAQVEHVADLDASNGWYDVSVSTNGDGRFLRRLAGHAETGRPSTSDPAIATH